PAGVVGEGDAPVAGGQAGVRVVDLRAPQGCVTAEVETDLGRGRGRRRAQVVVDEEDCRGRRVQDALVDGSQVAGEVGVRRGAVGRGALADVPRRDVDRQPALGAEAGRGATVQLAGVAVAVGDVA